MPYFENMAPLFEKPSEVSVENMLFKDKQLSQSHRTHVLSNALKSSIKVWSGLIKIIWFYMIAIEDRNPRKDYRKFLLLWLIFLGGEVDSGLSFYAQGKMQNG